MKQNKKILKIKNKKIIIEASDDYGEAFKDMTTGVVTDVAKFATDSLKFFGNMSKFLFKSSWYTFRAKILNNMSQEDYERALKSARVNFVDDSDNNIRSIDSNISQMLSKAGIPESEINSYLLGFPGYNVIENINVSSLLTGRAFDKLDDNKINPVKFSVLNLMIFYMFFDIEPSLRKENPQITNAFISKVLRERIDQTKRIKTLIRPFLKTKVDQRVWDILKYLKKTKSSKIMKILKECNASDSSSQYIYSKITKPDKATQFFNHAKSVFGSIKKLKEEKKENKPHLTINKNTLNLIKEEYKEEYNQAVWSSRFKNLIRSFAASVLLTNDEIAKIAREKYDEDLKKTLEEVEKEREANQQNKGKQGKPSFDRLEGLEKFVCTAGFEVNHHLAELKFLETLLSDNIATINESKNFIEKLLAAYKNVMGDNAKVFALIQKEITDFVNSRLSETEKSVGNKLEDLKKEEKDLRENYLKDDRLKNKFDELYTFKKKIILITYVKEAFDALEENFKDNSIDEFKKYAETVLNEKVNVNFIPDNIKDILESLKAFNPEDVKKKFGELSSKINNELSKAKADVEKAEPELKALQQQIENSSNESDSESSSEPDKSNSKPSS